MHLPQPCHGDRVLTRKVLEAERLQAHQAAPSGSTTHCILAGVETRGFRQSQTSPHTRGSSSFARNSCVAGSAENTAVPIMPRVSSTL